MAGPLPPKARTALEKSLSSGDPAPARPVHDLLLKHRAVPGAALFRLAMLEAGAGAFATADRLLVEADRRQPGDAQILVNRAQVRLALDDPEGALGLLSRLPDQVRANPAVIRLTAEAALSCDRLDEAIGAYEALAATGGGTDPAVLANHGTALRRLGRFEEAADKLGRAIDRGAGSEAVVGLAGLYGQLDQHDRAVDLLSAHLGRRPLDSVLLRQLAATERAAGDGGRARKAADRALLVAPGQASALVLLAEFAENAADLDGAERWARRALATAPDTAAAALVLASVARRRGDPAGSLSIVEAGIDRCPAAMRHLFLFERARSLETARRTDEAFAAFAEANARQVATARPQRDPGRALAQLEALAELHRAGPPVGEGDAGSDLLFVVGFPRSGTTLIDQVLDAHSRIEVVEERPLVAAMIADLTLSAHRYPVDLPALKEPEIEELRRHYRVRLARHTRRTDTRYTVDKMPLNMAHVALIRRVFPGARFILALRHPCDVVLSCFMQNFVLNDWMAAFSSLDGAAALYRATFTAWESYCRAVETPALAVRYEDVVADLEREARRITDFLDLPFEPGMLAFHDHARSRGVLATPSAAQVTQPIYRTALARWRRYDSVMAPIAQALSAEIERYGYAEEET
ncbi:sulfotransferase [Thalassobaculum sp. OXR-137]|uniref:tetratricopeptide repeat-containing sulfotransferase family protein n=1 Tax=Thalassobaculum sp. OXR-137 TaxID=3100173 RepID=UPI002AC95367|nr:sulfotransferase [Thalassobaculum sp. OXR-137]WPZ35470.1 sulfotransferase [Thalassobaculum sp. OXR-137]